MARICRRCGRPLDAEGHDVKRIEKDQVVPMVEGLHASGTQRPGLRGRGNIYGCKVRLIARSPVSGRVLIPHTPQRLGAIQPAFVHESRLQPGGDLHE